MNTIDKKNKHTKTNQGIHFIRKEYRKEPSKPPITSYGILAYTLDKNKKPLFLLAQRRDTIEYCVVLRGKYTKKQLEIYIQLLTKQEQERILKHSFDELWDDLWVHHSNLFYTTFYEKSKQKFIQNYDIICKLIHQYPSQIETPPWGIPKGKRNRNENEIKCAIREFYEETMIHIDYKSLVPTSPFMETFTGSNHKIYRTYYYIAHLKNKIIPPLNKCDGSLRKHTVSDESQEIRWCTLNEAKCILNDWRYNLLETLYQKIQSKDLNKNN